MYDKEKMSKFLRAIDKHAKKQETEILEEIKKIEKEELEKAEIEIIEDVRVMIQREIDVMKNKISVEVSHKELDERKKIARKRQKMMNEVFKESKNILTEFTRTEKYRQSLVRYANNISRKLNGTDVILYVYKEDLKYEDMIKKGFGRECKLEASDDIKIGGIRGYSKQESMIADETIDAKLCTLEDWFLEKYGNTLVQDFLGDKS